MKRLLKILTDPGPPVPRIVYFAILWIVVALQLTVLEQSKTIDIYKNTAQRCIDRWTESVR